MSLDVTYNLSNTVSIVLIIIMIYKNGHIDPMCNMELWRERALVLLMTAQIFETILENK